MSASNTSPRFEQGPHQHLALTCPHARNAALACADASLGLTGLYRASPSFRRPTDGPDGPGRPHDGTDTYKTGPGGHTSAITHRRAAAGSASLITPHTRRAAACSPAVREREVCQP